MWHLLKLETRKRKDHAPQNPVQCKVFTKEHDTPRYLKIESDLMAFKVKACYL